MTVHIPVLLEESIEHLELTPGKIVVDGTMGGGGHSNQFAERVGNLGTVIALDRDPLAVERVEDKLAPNVKPFCCNYADLPELLEQIEIPAVDAIFLDLGLSSDQLADESRGFSYNADGPPGFAI